MAPLLLAIDLGTTACKAAVFDEDGRILTEAYREYPLIKLSRMEIEQDAEEWWRLIKEVSSAVLVGLTDGQRKAIKALCLSVQGISFVPVDASGLPLCNALTWLDFRAEAEARALREVYTEKGLFALTGLRSGSFYTLPKIMWLKKKRPDIFARTRRFCTAQDFILSRLTGRFITDHSVAGGTLMHEVRMLKWSEVLIGMVPISLEQLPNIDWAGTVVGPLKSSIARELGVSEDLLVILGGHDQECAGLGAGLRPGEVTVSLGTASILLASIDRPYIDHEIRIPCLPSVEKDHWVLEAPVSVGGAVLRWLRDILNTLPAAWQGAEDGSLNYDRVIGLAENAPVGAAGVFFFPHLAGATSPFWLPEASGVYHGISLATSVFDLIRAVLEGWMFQIKSNLIILEELTGEVNRVIAFAGAARNGFITQMLADILQKPVAISETPETALLGASILAGVGAGIYRDVPSAQAETVRIAEVIYPHDEASNSYKDIYEHYREIEGRVLQLSKPD